MKSHNLLIRNGFIIDGTGAPAFKADIFIKDGVIVSIGEIGQKENAIEIDAREKIVCPGFIDSHSHADLFLLLGTSGQNQLEQGITSEILGPCGESAAPYYAGTYSAFAKLAPEESIKGMIDKLGSPKSFIDELETMDLGTNVGLLIGHLSVRGNVMGAKSEDPTQEELDQMREYVIEAMENGYLGFSTGLIYPPSVFASEEELTELASIAARYGGVYSTHLRGEDRRVVKATEEALRIAKNSHADLVISHHKIAGKQNEGLSVRTLELIDKANAEGQKVRMDQYPYLAGACPLADAIPPQFRTNGTEVFLQNLNNEEYREEIRRIIENDEGEFENFIYKSGFDGTLILMAQQSDLVGKTIADIAAERNGDPYDVFFDILIDNNLCVSAAYFMIVESDMKRIYVHPFTMLGTDFLHQMGSIKREQIGGWHPRSTASAVKRLCMCRDKKDIPLEMEIYRMTGMAADMYHLGKRGILKEGFAGDICIFDIESIKANADYKYPCRKNEGIEYVIVNGQIAVENGEFNGVRAGQVLKRKTKNVQWDI